MHNVSVRLRSSATVEACTMLTIADRRSGWSLLLFGRPVACQLYGLKILVSDSSSVQILLMLSFIDCLSFLMHSLAVSNLKLTNHIGLHLCKILSK